MQVVFVTVLFHAADWNEPERIFEVLTPGLTECCGWMAKVTCIGWRCLKRVAGFCSHGYNDIQRWCVFKWKVGNKNRVRSFGAIEATNTKIDIFL